MKKKALFALRIFGWLLVAVVTLEICARLEDRIRYGAPLMGNYSLDSLYTYDGMGKWGKPHSSYLKWHLNALGYRGPELRQGTTRIACLGSSETFGLDESPHKEWPRQLEAILNQRSGGQSYEVVDVAFPGMSVGTAVRRLPQVLNTVAPRMVVIYPSYTPYIDRPAPQPWPPASPGPTPKVQDRLQPRLQGKLETMMKTSLPQVVQMKIRNWQATREAHGEKAVDQLPEKNIDAFRQDLDTLTTQLQSRGVQVVLVTHATRFGKNLSREDRDFLISWHKFFPTLTEEGLLNMEHRMGDAVRQEGRERGVPVVDAATRMPAGPRDFAEFVHFTDAGARDLATMVANTVEQQAGSKFSRPNQEAELR